MTDRSVTTTEKEITATALGGAVATILVLTVEWLAGVEAPSGLEGALAVVFGAGTAYIRKLIRKREKKRAERPVDNLE